jgi:hypothetical protein
MIAESSSVGESHPHALTGRVEDWRAYGRVRWLCQGFRRGPQSGSRGNVSSPRLVSRVGDWRAYGRVRWLIQSFRRGPQSSSHGNVSNPRLVKRSVQISRTALSWMLHAKGYGTYQAGSAFGRDLDRRIR